LQIFSAAVLPNIIKIGQHLLEQSKKGELFFETQCSSMGLLETCKKEPFACALHKLGHWFVMQF